MPRKVARSTLLWQGGEASQVPFPSLEMLIKSKTTCREQDRADLVRLCDLLELKRQRGGST